MKYKVVLSLLLLLTVISSCEKRSKDEKRLLSVVVSIEPLKLILQEIVRDDIEISVLLKPGASPHHYELKPSDVAIFEKASALFYVTEGFDGWANSLNSSAGYNKCFSVKVLQLDGDKDGDPHFWTSPQKAKITAEVMRNAICTYVDSTNAKKYNERYTEFCRRLDSLHNATEGQLKSVKDIPIFTTHNFLSAYISEFALTYGGSLEDNAEGELGSKTFAKVVSAIKQANSRSIFAEPQASAQMVKTVAKDAKVDIAYIDPLGTKSRTYYEFIDSITNSVLAGLK